MLILHTSDWHLGRTLHGADLTRAFETWCSYVVELVRERGIDAVLISGDVYDRAVPPAGMVELLNDTLAQLSELTTVVATAGNHDSPTRLGFGAGLFRPSVVMRTDSRQAGRPIPLRDASGEVGAVVYGIPYLDPDRERVRLAPTADPEDRLERSHAAVMSAALGRIAEDIRSGEFAEASVARIVMAHAFVTGGTPSDSERDVTVGGVDNMPAELFRLEDSAREDAAALDYVALGHLHSPQRIELPGGPIVRYSGSPIAFSFSETAPKTSALLHIEEGRVTDVELLDAPVERAITTIEGTLRDILSPAHAADREKYARLRVTDPSRPRELVARIKDAFPYALEIRHLAEGSVRHGVPEVRERDGLSLLREFFTEAGGRELSDTELKLVVDVWEGSRD